MAMLRLSRGCIALGFFALVAGLPALGQPLSYDGYRILRVDVTTPRQLEEIERVGGEILNCTPGVGTMDVLVSAEEEEAVGNLGLATVVLQQDVGALIRQQQAGAVAAVTDAYTDFFLDYHDYDGVGGQVWHLNELAARYPGLASVVSVGTTLEGRTIWGVRITNSATTNKPGVVYFGAEHAREWITTMIPPYVARHLLENYGTDPVITDLVDHVEFYLIPVFNVDGYVYSRTTNRMWRKNRRNNGDGTFGVDINRNWGEGWGGPGSSATRSSETYRGTAAFSEPETTALRDFFIAHPNVRAQLDIHSYSQLILWPYGYTPTLSSDESYYQNVGGAMQNMIYDVHGTYFSIGPVYTAIYPASGVSVDWTYAQRNILSMSFECRDTGFYNFLLPPEQIIPSGEELLPAILHLTDADWVRSPMRFEFPNGLPAVLPSGQDTSVILEIVAQTETPVPGTPQLHYRYDLSGPFLDVALTSLVGGRYRATLPATNCLSTPEFYFSAQGSLGGLTTNPRRAATGEVYSAIVESSGVDFFTENLDADPGWTRQGWWGFGQPLGLGGSTGSPDPTAGHTGTNVFGYNLSGDYPDNLASEQYLTTGAINCTGRTGVRLSFWRWLGVEEAAWDHASVDVSNNGSTWTRVWANSSSIDDGAWVPQTIDISAVADNQSTVYLRWAMGTSDTAVNYCGWNIDDIRLSTVVCSPLIADYNGDGNVDLTDSIAFESCYSGSGIPHPPGCRIFDAEPDSDVDCDDWVRMIEGWTDLASPPVYPTCASRVAPAASMEGARYLGVQPANGPDPLAIRVTSPDWPCLTAYADFDPDPIRAAAGVARLGPAPVYRMASEWGLLHLADTEIAPGVHYEIRAELPGGGLSILSVAATLGWGDIAEVLGSTNVLDIAAVVDRVKTIPTAQSIERCDMHPAVPDHSVNVLDIASVVDAVKDIPYPYGAPCP